MSIQIRTKLGRQGFTLTELLVVIAVVSILAVIAVPSYLGMQKRATRSEAYSNLQALRLLEEQAFADSAIYVGPAANAQAIQVLFPRFNPGGNPTDLPNFGLNFVYAIVPNQRINTTNPLTFAVSTPCFYATATGIAGKNVAGEVYAIDCNNNRNF